VPKKNKNHPLTKSSKIVLKKTRLKVFVVFGVGVWGVCGWVKTVFDLSYHPLTKSSKIRPKTRFKGFFWCL
jgi:hypothetical protein